MSVFSLTFLARHRGAFTLTCVLGGMAMLLSTTTIGQSPQGSPDQQRSWRQTLMRPQSEMAEETNSIGSELGMVKFRRNIKIPAEAEGKLTEMAIEEGSFVSKGDVIAVVDDKAAQLTVELKRNEAIEAKINSENDINKRYAISSKELADSEAKALGELFKDLAVSKFEKEKKELEAERAGLQIELADDEKLVNLAKFAARRSELAMARHELTKRQIVAPFDGYIEVKDAQMGEWVQPGSPIATLVQIDKLKVEGDISAVGTGDRIFAGAPCTVVIDVNGETGEPIRIPAKLNFVSAEMGPRQTLRVWTEIDNQKKDGRWMIKPGMSADIVVGR